MFPDRAMEGSAVTVTVCACVCGHQKKTYLSWGDSMLGGNLPDSGIFQNTRGLSEGVTRVTQRGVGLKHDPWKCSFVEKNSNTIPSWKHSFVKKNTSQKNLLCRIVD